MKAYKLFRLRKNGTLGPLFIDRKLQVPLNKWLEAKDVPTKGYAHRPGWHSGAEPKAPHLSEKDRVWCECEVKDYYTFARPKHQGGEWIISNWLKVNKILTSKEVQELRTSGEFA